MRLAVLSQARDEEERVKPVKGERRFRGVKTRRMKARRMTHKDRREQRFRGVKTWADKNETNCLQELQTTLLRC